MIERAYSAVDIDNFLMDKCTFLKELNVIMHHYTKKSNIILVLSQKECLFCHSPVHSLFMSDLRDIFIKIVFPG